LEPRILNIVKRKCINIPTNYVKDYKRGTSAKIWGAGLFGKFNVVPLNDNFIQKGIILCT
jgi:hypothetical protein